MNTFFKITYNIKDDANLNQVQPKIALYKKPNIYIGRSKEVNIDINKLIELIQQNLRKINNTINPNNLHEYSLPDSLIPNNHTPIYCLQHPPNKGNNLINTYWIKTALLDETTNNIILRSFIRNPNIKELKMNLVKIPNTEYWYHRSELCSYPRYWIELYDKINTSKILLSLNQSN